MITKTYLDGKLRSLEERLERRIETKDNKTLHKMEADIAELKNSIKLLEEKISENRDLIENYIAKQNERE
ncbi:MAG: hypothetical protein U9N04_04175 [Patescibacteria group bacterium]|nr:hypothetical protein [Patescibacteria group bacterium]